MFINIIGCSFLEILYFFKEISTLNNYSVFVAYYNQYPFIDNINIFVNNFSNLLYGNIYLNWYSTALIVTL